jgi:hypothetical protein
MEHVHARHDAALSATVVRETPLRYAAGADPACDRPAHVRAASGLARLGGRLVAAQDDAAFLAVVDPASLAVDAVALPADEDGRRLFDRGRGNKMRKGDFEACVAVPDAGGAPAVLVFGSGSAPRRDRVAVLRDGAPPAAEVVDAARLYDALRACAAFAGSEMNVEGAAFVEGRVRLFNRGNGAARDGGEPVDATCDLAWPALAAFLASPGDAPPPRPERVVRYALGTLDGAPLNFTDGAFHRGVVRFTATAEDSPDAIEDGEVAGSVLGRIDGGDARWAPLRLPDGTSFVAKVEGVCPGDRDDEVFVVVDADDPDLPSSLCLVRLAGPWFERGT